MFLRDTPFSGSQMIDAALNVANEFRAKLGLPKLDSLVGRCGKGYNECGIANAVNHGLQGAPYFVMNNSTIEGHHIVTLHLGNPGSSFRNDPIHTVMDDAAWWFVQNFDSRKFPELMEEVAA